MKTNTTSVEREIPAAPMGVAAGVVGLISGLALWYFGAGDYEIFGQGFTFINSHLLAFHIGRYAGFSEYRERFALRARCILGVKKT